MKIAVFLKQVPDNTKLRFTEAGPVREGAEMMMNPYDEYALETAIRLKEAAGGDSTVVAISLGDPSAKEILKKAVSVGADEGFILSDPAFKDGDSTANATVLAKAADVLASGFDVLVFGQVSLDDAAGQTGPKVAQLLELPSITFCKQVEIPQSGLLRVKRETERGIETYDMRLPGVVCMMKCDYELRSANIKGVMKANKTEIPIKSAADLGLQPAQTGREGSLTTVAKTWQRPPKSAGVKVEGTDPKAAVGQLIGFLKEQKVL